MDEATQQSIKARIEQLEVEGNRVANAAAQQAYAPYGAAINELKRLIAPVPANLKPIKPKKS